MKNSSNLSITRTGQSLTSARTPRRLFSKSTQKLYNREPLQQNQQLGARVLHSFHTETVPIHTKTVQLRTETRQLKGVSLKCGRYVVSPASRRTRRS
jgi:hypothetical protein